MLCNSYRRLMARVSCGLIPLLGGCPLPFQCEPEPEPDETCWPVRAEWGQLRERYEYDDDGKLLRVFSNYLDGGSPQQICTLEYDGDALERVRYFQYEKLVGVAEFHGHGAGGPASMTFKDVSGAGHLPFTAAEYTYTEDGVLNAIDYDDGTRLSLFYDEYGNVMRAAHAFSSGSYPPRILDYEYDSAPPVERPDCFGYLWPEYDLYGLKRHNVLKQTDPSGKLTESTFEYTYNEDGCPATVSFRFGEAVLWTRVYHY